MYSGGGREEWGEIFFLMIRRPPRSTRSGSSAASDVYRREVCEPGAGTEDIPGGQWSRQARKVKPPTPVK